MRCLVGMMLASVLMLNAPVEASDLDYPGLMPLHERLHVGDTLPMDQVRWMVVPARNPRPTYRIYYIFMTTDQRLPLMSLILNTLHTERSDLIDVAYLTYQTTIEIETDQQRRDWRPAHAIGRVPITLLQRISGRANPHDYAIITDNQDRILWRGLTDHLSQNLRRVADNNFNIDRSASIVRLMDEYHMARQTGKMDVAIGLLDRILMVDPIQSEALPVRMQIAQSMGDTETIRRMLSRIDPTDISPSEAATIALFMLKSPRLHQRFPRLTLGFVRRLAPESATDVQAAYAMLWWHHNLGNWDAMERQLAIIENLASPLARQEETAGIREYIAAMRAYRGADPLEGYTP